MLEHCPAWSTSDIPRFDKLFRSTGKLPVTELTAVLKNGNADHRQVAAVVLTWALNYLPPVERAALQAPLITALSDSNIHVREAVAGSVRELNTVEGNAALGRTLAGVDVTDVLYFQTGRAGPLPDADNRIGDLLRAAESSSDLHVPELVTAFPNARSDHRLAIVRLFTSTIRSGSRILTPSDSEMMTSVLLQGVRDPNIDVSREAINGLALVHPQNAIDAVSAALDRPDATQGYIVEILRMLPSFQSQHALPILER
jgi:hypothetical protein